MAAHRRALLLLVAALTTEAVVVDTTAALRAAVDRQEATIRLGADLSLGGEPLIITADCDLRGNGYALLQGAGVRHMHVMVGTTFRAPTRGGTRARGTAWGRCRRSRRGRPCGCRPYSRGAGAPSGASRPSRPRRSRPAPATSAAASRLTRPLVPTAARATRA